MTQTAKTFKRTENGRITLEGVNYEAINSEKASTVLSAASGLRIHSIRIDEKTYYPVGIVKEKKK
jgi:hypothetical protein